MGSHTPNDLFLRWKYFFVSTFTALRRGSFYSQKICFILPKIGNYPINLNLRSKFVIFWSISLQLSTLMKRPFSLPLEVSKIKQNDSSLCFYPCCIICYFCGILKQEQIKKYLSSSICLIALNQKSAALSYPPVTILLTKIVLILLW